MTLTHCPSVGTPLAWLEGISPGAAQGVDGARKLLGATRALYWVALGPNRRCYVGSGAGSTGGPAASQRTIAAILLEADEDGKLYNWVLTAAQGRL